MHIKLDSHKLNISEKSRVSRFPWRGQFSPELIEYLLFSFFEDAQIIYDPFCGSGTVLFESSLLGKTSYGSEINPAAWCLSSSIHLNRLNDDGKKTLIKELNNIFLFQTSVIDIIEIAKTTRNKELRISLTTVLLLGYGNNQELNSNKLNKSFNDFIFFLESLDTYKGLAYSYLEDSRYTSLDDNSVDGVITSPPYINVFNYHQNYRFIMEMLGWSPLDAARSEIGANRKFRQNRFMTVVQYVQDMSMSLNELARVKKLHSISVMIVGRESKVLGESFENSKLILKLINSHSSFSLLGTYERNFKNKYGQNIVEDLIIFKKTSQYSSINIEIAASIGIQAIVDILKNASDQNIQLMKEVISKADKIEPSKKFNIEIPYS